jgi:PAS domain S-box-containing protein
MTVTDPDALLLAAIVRSSDDAIISHAIDGRIESWNPAAERMFGYTSGEAVGRHIDLIIPDSRVDEDRRLAAEVCAGLNVNHFETVAVTKEGGEVIVSLAIAPIIAPGGELLGLSRILRDLSRQQALEHQALRLSAIVDSAEDAIVSKSLDGIVQTWNRAAERMFGYTSAEIVGKSITTIIPKDRLSEEAHVLSEIRAGRAVEHFETVRMRKDGSQVEISLTVSPIRRPDGRIIGASKIARNISAQRRLAREAEEANRVKDEFLAMLSHELRTPLNAVLGYTRMLRSPDYPADRQARTIDTIERNANLLSQLVSDVLDVSTIVTGKVQLKAMRCDLVGIVNASVDMVRPSAEAKGITLAIDPTAAPLPAMCDSDRMQQVLWNLLVNAVKFTPTGGRVDVAVRDDAHRVAVISVRDTGVGIPRETLPFVFQRFWQGESRRESTGGLGLGLALARHFTELHGGTVTAESEGEGRGATFTVKLPLLAK